MILLNLALVYLKPQKPLSIDPTKTEIQQMLGKKSDFSEYGTSHESNPLSEGISSRIKESKSSQNKKDKAIIEASKELLKKNNEFIETVEKKLNNIDQLKSESIKEKKIEKTKPENKNEGQERSTLPDVESKSTYPFTHIPSPFIEKQSTQNSPIKKISDLLFKSTIVTKNEILNKDDSAVLIENNNKIKSIIGQLQKILDTSIAILNKFREDKDTQDLSPQKEKPKDVMKYQVIEVTENKNENK